MPKSYSSAIFIDTFSRDLTVYTVSVTEIPNEGIVLRMGMEMGSLWELTQNDRKFWDNPGMPLIVATRGYQALGSAGFVDVLASPRGESTRTRKAVVGEQGFPWQESGALRPRSAMEVVVLRPETHVWAEQTHAQRGTGPYPAWHSNTATAKAAREGIELKARLQPESVFVVEGQSDYAQAWRLAPFSNVLAQSPAMPEIKFPVEHRLDIFCPEGAEEETEPATEAGEADPLEGILEEGTLRRLAELEEEKEEEGLPSIIL